MEPLLFLLSLVGLVVAIDFWLRVYRCFQNVQRIADVLTRNAAAAAARPEAPQPRGPISQAELRAAFGPKTGK
jgi:hypothetical protein